MMASGIIVDVNEIDFEYEVLAYSNSVPVVVDFWAEWCRPCKTLGPMLERLAIEANGHFRLARVDADANPNLTLRYRVHSLPTVKAFSSGEVAAEFVGCNPNHACANF
jgi:putative thioredoxin